MSFPEKKNVALRKFLESTTHESCDFWAGEALEARTWGSLNITLAQKWHSVIFQISVKKVSRIDKRIHSTYWMNLEILLHDFFKLQPPKLYKNVQEFGQQIFELFACEINFEKKSSVRLCYVSLG